MQAVQGECFFCANTSKTRCDAKHPSRKRICACSVYASETSPPHTSSPLTATSAPTAPTPAAPPPPTPSPPTPAPAPTPALTTSVVATNPVTGTTTSAAEGDGEQPPAKSSTEATVGGLLAALAFLAAVGGFLVFKMRNGDDEGYRENAAVTTANPTFNPNASAAAAAAGRGGGHARSTGTYLAPSAAQVNVYDNGSIQGPPVPIKWSGVDYLVPSEAQATLYDNNAAEARAFVPGPATAPRPQLPASAADADLGNGGGNGGGSGHEYEYAGVGNLVGGAVVPSFSQDPGTRIVYAVPMEDSGGIYATVGNDAVTNVPKYQPAGGPECDNAGAGAGAAGVANDDYESVGEGGAAAYVDPDEVGMRAGDDSPAYALVGARGRADTFC